MTTPGWYPDPTDPSKRRWWDGASWGALAPGEANVAVSPGDAPSSDGPPNRRSRKVLIIAALAVATGAAVGVAMAVSGSSGAKTFTTHGVMEVDGAAATPGGLDVSEADIIYKGTKCFTVGSYDDIAKGTQVTVSDENDKTIGVGELGDGRYADSSCIFPFTVDKLPAGRKFYKVEVSHRGGIQYTEKQMRAGDVAVSLGN